MVSTMRSTLLSLVALLALATASHGYAECFGEAAEAYGCGVSAPQEGQLQQFASSNQGVVPYYGSPKRSPYDGLFTRQEQRQMLRSIVLGHLRGNQQAANAFNRAMNYNAQAIRRSGNQAVNVWYSGW